MAFPKGKKHSIESKKKMSTGQKRRGKFSEETRKKMSISHIGKQAGAKNPMYGKKFSMNPEKVLRGVKHPNWKGGLTPISERIRHSKEYLLWRRSVLERDGKKCIWCFSKENLQADHIKPFSLYPELRFAIDNGRTLCKSCHMTTCTWGNKKSRVFSSEPTL